MIIINFSSGFLVSVEVMKIQLSRECFSEVEGVNLLPVNPSSLIGDVYGRYGKSRHRGAEICDHTGFESFAERWLTFL